MLTVNAHQISISQSRSLEITVHTLPAITVSSLGLHCSHCELHCELCFIQYRIQIKMDFWPFNQQKPRLLVTENSDVKWFHLVLFTVVWIKVTGSRLYHLPWASWHWRRGHWKNFQYLQSECLPSPAHWSGHSSPERAGDKEVRKEERKKEHDMSTRIIFCNVRFPSFYLSSNSFVLWMCNCLHVHLITYLKTYCNFQSHLLIFINSTKFRAGNLRLVCTTRHALICIYFCHILNKTQMQIFNYLNCFFGAQQIRGMWSSVNVLAVVRFWRVGNGIREKREWSRYRLWWQARGRLSHCLSLYPHHHQPPPPDPSGFAPSS